MRIKRTDLQTTLYTPNGLVWTLDSKESTGLYHSAGNIFTHWSLASILGYQDEVSTEPYSRKFNVGDEVTTVQEAHELPANALIIDRNRIPFQKIITGDWYTIGEECLYLTTELDLPATILWLPEDKETDR